MEQQIAQLTSVRNAHRYHMELTARTLGHLIAPLTHEQATTLRDGPAGWTVTEVLGHLRDFDGFFRGRAVMMLEGDYPQLPAYDHEAIAIEGRYNEQDFRRVYDELLRSRAETRAFFAALSPEGWERAGVHPERGHFTMTDAVMQVGLHEAGHIEQILKIVTQRV
jgi:hypothetical protein